MRILLASPRGFCAGVERAITTVEVALERFGPPIYVRHQIVHNTVVIASLEARGVVFIDRPDEAPEGAVLVFSAHGVSPQVCDEAKARRQHVIDATCPLVTKVHLEARRSHAAGEEIVLVGHAGHVEVEGTMGQVPSRIQLVETTRDAERIAVTRPGEVRVLTQTTLSVDDTQEVMNKLRDRFPGMSTPRSADICYATTNRQEGVKRLAKRVELVLVVGSSTSSNGMRLVDTARRAGVDCQRIDGAHEIKSEWLEGVDCVGVTSGAAVPESLVEAVIARLQSIGGPGTSLERMPEIKEPTVFKLPASLAAAAK